MSEADPNLITADSGPASMMASVPSATDSRDIDDDPGSVSGSVSLGGFPPVEERSRPDGAEEEAPDTNRTSGDDGDDEEV
jgi:hypothetical protein